MVLFLFCSDRLLVFCVLGGFSGVSITKMFPLIWAVLQKSDDWIWSWGAIIPLIIFRREKLTFFGGTFS